MTSIVKLKEENKILVNKIIDWIAILVLGFFSCLYTLFYSKFAELRIDLPFLGFPIFIGEILLATCVILLVVKYLISPLRFRRWHYLLFVYGAFILIKASHGYFLYGPLAFRNAALFYYFIFAVLSYHFFDKRFLNKKFIYISVLLILITAIIFHRAVCINSYTYFILTLVLLLSIKHKRLKYIAILLFLLVFPYYLLFNAARSVFISYIAAWLFLFVVLFFLLKIKMAYKIILPFLLITVFALFVYFFADLNKIKSLITPHALLKQYRNYTCSLDEKTKNFKSVKNVPVRLYLNNRGEKSKPVAQQQKLSTQQKRLVIERDRITAKYIGALAKSETKIISPKDIKVVVKTPEIEEPKSKSKKYRPLKHAYGSMVWRLIVWKDMLNELFYSKNIFGMDFGKPFRSRTLEILGSSNFGQQVGWIEPHNSYIHILYRSGVVGLLFIVVVLGLFIRMVRLFIVHNSVNGILLSSTLLSWLIFPNFAVVLELPYFAIPFWCLFGVTMKYSSYFESLKQGEKVE
jgi:hypothetical protein